jgi:hypothetical protein
MSDAPRPTSRPLSDTNLPRSEAGPVAHDDEIELIVLSVRRSSASCRVVDGGEPVTLHLGHRWDVVPGEIAVVEPERRWARSGHCHVSGIIASTRIEPAALGVMPLPLEEQGIWNPAEEYWGDEGEPIEEWAKPIIARGPRPQFEMQQVPTREEPDDPFDDPIIEAVEQKELGNYARAYNILMGLCHADLRCLDAHAHLGNLMFDRQPRRAIRHYEVGVRIGEWSLGDGFSGLLPWGLIDNRPFLRCMQGFGLCLWRLRRFEEAWRIFDRMLWLNPSDNQGMRYLIDQVGARRPWKPD